MAQVIDGVVAPAGGFQQGGWYNSRQYWNGTLSAPGVINSQSDQIGAGQAVSKEVVQQTNPANWDYIQQQQKQQQQQQQKVNTPQVVPQVTTPQAQSGGGTGATIPAVATPTIDLTSIYNNLYKNSGITDTEKKIAEIDASLNSKQQAYNLATNNVNDNPFLSEAGRVGRNEKVKQGYESSIANDINQLNTAKNDIATKKADIETKLNLELKQFDINSQQAQQALSQFNTLLSMGALDGASGEDIANITRQTGLSSTMINNAITAKNKKQVETSIMNFDDGTNQGFVVIDKSTGEIIARENIASSKPKSEGSGKVSESEIKSEQIQIAKEAAQKGATVSQMFQLYSGILDPDLIYQIYNANSKYGPDKGDTSALAKYGVKQPTY